MPSARELLEQAGALMRRNRGAGADRAPLVPQHSEQNHLLDDPLRGFLPDVATLVQADAVESGADESEAIDSDVPLAPTVILPEIGAGESSAPAHVARDALAVPLRTDATDIAAGDLADGTNVTVGDVADDANAANVAAGSELSGSAWLETLSDLPILTDVVEIGALPLAASSESVAIPGESSPSEVVLRSGEPPSVADTPPSEELQPSEELPRSEPASPPGETDWSALAEEIRAQVLQRLDLFTDTGLREQLGAHLQPIVDRASAELVDAITRQVGELVRRYVAEAIEREIEAWRDRSA